jgi:hypothetical protein
VIAGLDEDCIKVPYEMVALAALFLRRVKRHGGPYEQQESS